MSLWIVNFLAAYAETTAVYSGIWQLKKLRATKDKHGLSVWSWILNTAASLGWMVYGFRIKVWPVFIASFVWIYLCVWVLHFLVSTTKLTKALLYAVIIGMSLALLLADVRHYAGWIAFCFSLISSAPQFWKAYTDKKLSGLSLWSFIQAFVAELATFIYSVAIGAAPLIASSLRGMGYNGFVIYEVSLKKNFKKTSKKR